MSLHFPLALTHGSCRAKHRASFPRLCCSAAMLQQSLERRANRPLVRNADRLELTQSFVIILDRLVARFEVQSFHWQRAERAKTLAALYRHTIATSQENAQLLFQRANKIAGEAIAHPENAACATLVLIQFAFVRAWPSAWFNPF